MEMGPLVRKLRGSGKSPHDGICALIRRLMDQFFLFPTCGYKEKKNVYEPGKETLSRT
jgi:hypothetical protein